MMYQYHKRFEPTDQIQVLLQIIQELQQEKWHYKRQCVRSRLRELQLRRKNAQLETENTHLRDNNEHLEAHNADLTYRLETALDENEELKWSAVEGGHGNITSLADRRDWEERFPEQFN